MKDIDFDELDKAVNSLMQTAEDTGITPEVAMPAQEVTPVTTPEPAAIVELPNALPPAPAVAAAPAEPPAQPVTAPKPAAPSLATKRSGRFMDVVHPSSDMRVNDKPTIAPPRTGITLQPLNEVVAEQPAAPQVETPPVTEPSVEPADAPDETLSSDAEAAMADELTKNLEAITKANDVTEPTQEEEADIPEAATTEIAEQAPEAPQTSPFLPDTKVEKRPLGGAAAPVEEPTAELPVDEAPLQPEAPPEPTDTPAETTSVPADLPPELHGDVAALEASVPVAVTDETPAPAVVAGGNSIVQQYKEAAPVQTNHTALYDAAAKDAPLAHPAKTKSGWAWVLWIVLLIVLGAAAAATAYYMKWI